MSCLIPFVPLANDKKTASCPPRVLSLRDRGSENQSGTVTAIEKLEIVAKTTHVRIAVHFRTIAEGSANSINVRDEC
jgi:hypothetical protein